jgi:hypothetical protein
VIQEEAAAKAREEAEKQRKALEEAALRRFEIQEHPPVYPPPSPPICSQQDAEQHAPPLVPEASADDTASDGAKEADPGGRHDSNQWDQMLTEANRQLRQLQQELLRERQAKEQLQGPSLSQDILCPCLIHDPLAIPLP